jgi:hypothetical protein
VTDGPLWRCVCLSSYRFSHPRCGADKATQLPILSHLPRLSKCYISFFLRRFAKILLIGIRMDPAQRSGLPGYPVQVRHRFRRTRSRLLARVPSAYRGGFRSLRGEHATTCPLGREDAKERRTGEPKRTKEDEKPAMKPKGWTTCRPCANHWSRSDPTLTSGRLLHRRPQTISPGGKSEIRMSTRPLARVVPAIRNKLK